MIGKYPARLDDKHRLFVPAKLRGELADTLTVMSPTFIKPSSSIISIVII